MAVATSTGLLGRPLWFELVTTDMKAAEQFYSAVVGWTVTPFRSGSEPYDMWTRTGENSVGGVMPVPQGMKFPPHWVMYIGVPNLEEAIAHVERLGGSAMSPVIQVPDVGRMRIMHDAQGAMFAIFEPAPSTGSANSPETPAELGEASWRELQTNDAAAAMRFYADLFGWREAQSMDMGPMGKYHIFARQWDLGGIMNKPPEMANCRRTGAVLPRGRCRQRRGTRQGQWRAGAQRADGSARRRLDRQLPGSAGRELLAAPAEGELRTADLRGPPYGSTLGRRSSSRPASTYTHACLPEASVPVIRANEARCS